MCESVPVKCYLMHFRFGAEQTTSKQQTGGLPESVLRTILCICMGPVIHPDSFMDFGRAQAQKGTQHNGKTQTSILFGDDDLYLFYKSIGGEILMR